MRKWRKMYPIENAWATLRDNARKRGIQFEITIHQWRRVIKKFPDYIDKRGCLLPQHLQIDRKDRTKGYTYRNIQVLTFEENRRKEYFELSLDKKKHK